MEDKDWKPKRNPNDKLGEDIGMILTVLTLLMFVIGAVMMFIGSDGGTRSGGGTGAMIFFIGIIMSFFANIFTPD